MFFATQGRHIALMGWNLARRSELKVLYPSVPNFTPIRAAIKVYYIQPQKTDFKIFFFKKKSPSKLLWVWDCMQIRRFLTQRVYTSAVCDALREFVTLLSHVTFQRRHFLDNRHRLVRPWGREKGTFRLRAWRCTRRSNLGLASVCFLIVSLALLIHASFWCVRLSFQAKWMSGKNDSEIRYDTLYLRASKKLTQLNLQMNYFVTCERLNLLSITQSIN